jgi:hypothetical protein
LDVLVPDEVEQLETAVYIHARKLPWPAGKFLQRGRSQCDFSGHNVGIWWWQGRRREHLSWCSGSWAFLPGTRHQVWNAAVREQVKPRVGASVRTRCQTSQVVTAFAVPIEDAMEGWPRTSSNCFFGQAHKRIMAKLVRSNQTGQCIFSTSGDYTSFRLLAIGNALQLLALDVVCQHIPYFFAALFSHMWQTFQCRTADIIAQACPCFWHARTECWFDTLGKISDIRTRNKRSELWVALAVDAFNNVKERHITRENIDGHVVVWPKGQCTLGDINLFFEVFIPSVGARAVPETFGKVLQVLN